MKVEKDGTGYTKANLLEFVASGEFEKLLHQLGDDEGLTHRGFGIQIDKKTIDEENRTCTFVLSSESIDSHGHIVVQDWEGDGRLRRFLKNPVVLYGHNHAGGLFGSAEDTLPIGFCEEIGVVDGQLRGRARFVDERANKMAERVWQGIVQGSLRAVSVGFIPHKVTVEYHDDREQLILSENELFEFSVVPKGSNLDAVRLSAEGKTKERQRLLGLAKQVDEETMTPEEKAKLDKAEKDAKEASAKLAMLEAEHAQSKSAIEAAEKKARAAEQRAEKAAAEQLRVKAQQIATEVKSFTGTKITPAQVDLYKGLRCSPQGDDFLKFVELGADSGLTEEQIVDPIAPSGDDGDDGDNALLKAVNAIYESDAADD